MKRITLLFYVINICLFAQTHLPKGFLPKEKLVMDKYLESFNNKLTPPPAFPVRTMAEWEEIKALTLSWNSYPGILTEIIKQAVSEVEVIIFCEDSNSVKNTLYSQNINLENVNFIQEPTNSIWIRDYGQHTVYKDKVGQQYLVDWIYNRPRPLDDASPNLVSNYFNYDLFATNSGENLLVNTGGNFMTDGMGTAFASELIIEENDGSGPYNSVNYPNHDENEIDSIMNLFMGINNYIKMETLPYDGIHHIDMHMKIINEETILVSEYPPGESDGPQIEENINYILNNYLTPYGNQYKIVRIPSPPSTSGNYPADGGYYRTYTNSVFINKKILVPFYREEFDTIAQRIYEEILPGYEVVGIDCDDSNDNIIAASGAIHCITKAVGVDSPLLINHAPKRDMEYKSIINFQAKTNHFSGIDFVQLHYKKESDLNYTIKNMVHLNDDIFSLDIFGLPANEKISYFFKARANSGKEINRPIVAPIGGFEFTMFSDLPNSQIIYLKEGWNLISSYIYKNDDIQNIFADVSSNISIVKNNLGEVYLPEFSFNSIQSYNLLDAYYVKMKTEDSLLISGAIFLPEEWPLILSEGWSLISYLRYEPNLVNLVFNNLTESDNLIIVKDYFGQMYLPQFNFNAIGEMEPGQGYQIKISNPDTLKFLPFNQYYE